MSTQKYITCHICNKGFITKTMVFALKEPTLDNKVIKFTHVQHVFCSNGVCDYNEKIYTYDHKYATTITKPDITDHLNITK